LTNMDSKHGKEDKLIVLPYTNDYDIKEFLRNRYIPQNFFFCSKKYERMYALYSIIRLWLSSIS
jgi:hypothetical protein